MDEVMIVLERAIEKLAAGDSTAAHHLAADAVAWLMAAPGVTGQMIAVDAGQHLAWPNG